MARYNVFAGTSDSVPTAITTGTAQKTLLQLVTSASARCVVIEWGVAFAGTSGTAAPITVFLARQTTAGTGGVAARVTKINGGAEVPAATSTGLSGPTGAAWGAEPTASDVVGGPWFVHPQSGLVIQYPLSREIMVPLSTRLAIVASAAAAVNAHPYFVIDEL